jgi:type II restriction/modification system DNA methylase subunit YeeA
MKHPFSLIILFTSLLCSCITGPQEIDPQTTIEGTIQKAISLIEQKDYEALFMEIAHPQDILVLTGKDGIPLEDLINDFDGQPAEYLLQILKIIQNKEPVLNPDKTKAEWKITEADMGNPPPQPVIMEKYEEKWYLRN